MWAIIALSMFGFIVLFSTLFLADESSSTEGRIEGVIIKKERSAHGFYNIKVLKNQRKSSFYLWYYNNIFVDFIQIGDSIFSASGSDSIAAYRNGQEYKFVRFSRAYRKNH